MDQTAFQKLLMRSEYNHSTDDFHLPKQREEKVTISRAEYEDLRQISRHFQKLKDSLVNGGLSLETLDVLIYGPKPPKSEHVDYQIPGAAPGNANVKPVRHSLSRRPSATTGNMDKENRVPNGEYYSVMNSGNNHYHEDSDSDSLSQEGDSKNHCVVDELPSGRSSAAPSRGPTPRGQRTVALHNLPNWVTHQQITEGIRGGALLHIFLRGREHIVNVSFVEEEAAQEFLTYAKCHGVCIAGKRVEPTWADRQFYLPPYVRAKIRAGATRSIIIHNVFPGITETLIRQDLEHIHNLVVVSVRFGEGNAYISTNSVHNALFARSCMISRVTYKGMRIGFFEDECDRVIPRVVTSGSGPGPEREKGYARQVSGKKRDPGSNRFQPLALDGESEVEGSDGCVDLLDMELSS